MIWDIALSDWISWLKTLPDNSIQVFFTSPPYWGLRDYGVEGQLGLEKTPAQYIKKMVAGFRELRRVLRKDGTLWLNMGDSYAGSGKRQNGDGTHSVGGKQSTNKGSAQGGLPKTESELKPKDMVGMPWRVALALQADGWYLRQDIIWSKPNSMPGSMLDRCCTAHEYVFLLSKSKRYYFDQEAIKEPSSLFTHSRGNGVNPKARKEGINSRFSQDQDPRHVEYERNKTNGVGWGMRGALEGRKATRTKQNESFSAATTEVVTERIKRSVWEIATSPFPEAHFATFPPALVEPGILAGTSEKGCCAVCRAPWKRILSKADSGMKQKMADNWDTGDGGHGTIHRNGREKGSTGQPIMISITVGWEQTCKCKTTEPPIPCTVGDPFSGAGTTCLVAVRLGRSFKGSELKAEYRDMAIRRVEQDAPLFNLQSRVSLPETEQLAHPLLPLSPLPDGTAS